MGILSEGPAGLRILGFDKAEKGGCMTAFLFCVKGAGKDVLENVYL